MRNLLIIGASSGIGKAIATQAIADGYHVISASRNAPDLSQIEHHTVDITADDIDWSFIPDELHGLVYAPGTINLKPFHRFKLEEFQQDFDINVLGAVKAMQAAFKSLKAVDSASVVLFSTVAAKLGMNFHASIATAKAAVEGLARTAAAEWSQHNIRVNVLAPSLTDTPLAGRILSTDDKKEASNKRHPIGRYGQPEDLANAAMYLLSEGSSWVSGQTIGVDGGMGALKP
mgnify:CR=1 FL=1